MEGTFGILEEDLRQRQLLNDESNAGGVGPRTSIAQTYYNTKTLTVQQLHETPNVDEVPTRPIEFTDKNGHTWAGVVFAVQVSGGDGLKVRES